MTKRITETSRLRLLLGGTALVLLGSSGIAAMMAAPPGANGDAAAPELTEDDARVRVRCAECGVVESLREIAQLGAGIDPGAAAGIAAGGRNQPLARTASRYEVVVRMQDGSNHVFMPATAASWRLGERLIRIQGARQAVK